MLLDAGRISFKGKPADILGDRLNHITVLPITVAIATPALALPHSDPFDRILTATAKLHGLTLVTKDIPITDPAVAPTRW
jgi:PIN domain nuclease of toxin-antitoxin system